MQKIFLEMKIAEEKVKVESRFASLHLHCTEIKNFNIGAGWQQIFKLIHKVDICTDFTTQGFSSDFTKFSIIFFNF